MPARMAPQCRQRCHGKMKKKPTRPQPLIPTDKRSIPQSLVSVLFGLASILLLLLVIDAVQSSRIIWPAKLGPISTTYLAEQPGLFWIGVALHVVGVVATAAGAYATWRLAGPIPPPSVTPRPKRPPNDYPQYRKKKSP